MILFITQDRQLITMAPGDRLGFIKATDERGPYVALQLFHVREDVDPILMTMEDDPAIVDQVFHQLAWLLRQDRDRPLVIVDVEDLI